MASPEEPDPSNAEIRAASLPELGIELIAPMTPTTSPATTWKAHDALLCVLTRPKLVSDVQRLRYTGHRIHQSEEEMGGCSPTISSLRWWPGRSLNTVVVARQSGRPTTSSGVSRCPASRSRLAYGRVSYLRE